MSEEGEWGDLAVEDVRKLDPHHLVVTQYDALTARLTALEAAARELVDACHPGKQHMPWTQLAALAALLEEG